MCFVKGLLVCGAAAALHAYVCSATSRRTPADLILYGPTLNRCLALLRRQCQFTTASCAWQQLGSRAA